VPFFRFVKVGNNIDMSSSTGQRAAPPQLAASVSRCRKSNNRSYSTSSSPHGLLGSLMSPRGSRAWRLSLLNRVVSSNPLSGQSTGGVGCSGGAGGVEGGGAGGESILYICLQNTTFTRIYIVYKLGFLFT